MFDKVFEFFVGFQGIFMGGVNCGLLVGEGLERGGGQ